MIDDVALFVQIVRARGLSAAGEQLNLPAATVTRRLQKLEDKVGCRLIHRSARKFSLTAEGESYFQAYVDLMDQFEVTGRVLSAEIHQLSGPLKVAAPTNISVGMLQPMWSEFIGAYRDIRLNLLLNNEVQDMLDAQVDLALRIGPQMDSSMTQKRLGSVSTIMVASPGYLAEFGCPGSLEDLKDHRLIVGNSIPVWELLDKNTGKTEMLHPIASTNVNDIGFARQLAVDGNGIALLPVVELYECIGKGQLDWVLSDWTGPQRHIYAVWPTGRLLSARAKCLRDFMRDYIARIPLMQGEIPT